jgi:magnesium transporter
MGVFILPDRLIFILPEDNLILLPRFYTQLNTLTEVALRLILRVIHHFNEHLKVVNMISGEIEDQINTSMENSSLIQLFALEKSLVYYVNSINSNGLMIERLRLNAQKPDTFGFQKEHMDQLDDLVIENRQTYEQAHIYSDILAGLMDARVSIVSNNLNILMRNLTLVMIACMWPPLVCGFFAMNVRLPLDHESAHPFYWALGLSFVPLIVVGIIYWWRRRRK